MSSPQERVSKALDAVTKPLQLVIGMLKTTLLGCLLLLVAICTPIFIYLSGGTVTALELESAATAILFIFTFIVAPWYTAVGGVISLIGFALLMCFNAFRNLMYTDAAPGPLGLLNWFLVIGILQWLVRKVTETKSSPSEYFISIPPSRSFFVTVNGHTEHIDYRHPKYLYYLETIDAGKSENERSEDGEEDEAGFEENDAVTGKIQGSLEAEIAGLIAQSRACDCAGCADAYRVLEVDRGCNAAIVKSAYRDLAKVWHPDRFSADDKRLVERATEQFKRIHLAYSQLQGHQPPPNDAIEIDEMPLKSAVDCTTAAIVEFNRRAVTLFQRVQTIDITDEDDGRYVLGQALAMQQDSVNRLQRLIRRFEREMPSFSRSELDATLITCDGQRAKLIQAGVRAGLIGNS